MKTIKAKTETKPAGRVTTYKDGRRMVAEVWQYNSGKIAVLCAFTPCGCLSFDYDDEARATEKTIDYIKSLYFEAVEIVTA